MVRFFGEADLSRIGLMNAVTSVARDTRNPEMRWGLEKLGGEIPAALVPKLLPKDSGCDRQREVMVG